MRHVQCMFEYKGEAILKLHHAPINLSVTKREREDAVLLRHAPCWPTIQTTTDKYVNMISYDLTYQTSSMILINATLLLVHFFIMSKFYFFHRQCCALAFLCALVMCSLQ